MMPKRRKPTHPGKILLEEFLKPLGMTSRQFAEKLGGDWSEVKVEAIIQGKENLSSHAVREFAALLDTSTDFWQYLQNLCSHWEEIHQKNEKGALKPWKKAQ
jgi:antitoxin HigA-1